MNISQYMLLVEKEIDLYEKIFKQNSYLMESSDNINIDTIAQKMYNKNSLLDEIQKIDKTLTEFWKNWEEYKKLCSDEDILKIKTLRELIERNLEMENKIMEKFKNLLSKSKEKTIHVQQGNKAFNAYKANKANISYFINKKG